MHTHTHTISISIEQVLPEAPGSTMDAPSDTVRNLSQRMQMLKKMLHKTKAAMLPLTPDAAGGAAAAPGKEEEEARAAPAAVKEAPATGAKKSVFDRLHSQRNTVGQSKYKKLEQICKRLVKRPAFVEWLDVARSERGDAHDRPHPASSCAASQQAHNSHNHSKMTMVLEDVDKENSWQGCGGVKLNLSGLDEGEQNGVACTPHRAAAEAKSTEAAVREGSVFDRLQVIVSEVSHAAGQAVLAGGSRSVSPSRVWDGFCRTPSHTLASTSMPRLRQPRSARPSVTTQRTWRSRRSRARHLRPPVPTLAGGTKPLVAACLSR